MHREELESLIPLAEKLEIVHGDHEKAPTGPTEAFIVRTEDHYCHMMKEEDVLFAMMRSGGNPMIVHPIDTMRHEHDDAEGLLNAVLEIARGLTLPAGACRSWTALYTGIDNFAKDLLAHIALENTVLFPRFERA